MLEVAGAKAREAAREGLAALRPVPGPGRKSTSNDLPPPVSGEGAAVPSTPVRSEPRASAACWRSSVDRGPPPEGVRDRASRSIRCGGGRRVERHRAEVGQRQRLTGVLAEALGRRLDDPLRRAHVDRWGVQRLVEAPMAGLIIEREHDRVPGHGHGGVHHVAGVHAQGDRLATAPVPARTTRSRRPCRRSCSRPRCRSARARRSSACSRRARPIRRNRSAGRARRWRQAPSMSPTLGGTTRRRDEPRSRPSWSSGWCRPARGRSTATRAAAKISAPARPERTTSSLPFVCARSRPYPLAACRSARAYPWQSYMVTVPSLVR